MGIFSKNVVTEFFDELVQKVENNFAFADAVTIDKSRSKEELERNNYVVWYNRPARMPDYESTSQVDLTGKFDNPNDNLIPVRVNVHNSSPFLISATELNDEMRRQHYMDQCVAQLSGRFNQKTIDTIVDNGSLTVKRGTLTGYDDVSDVRRILRETGYGNLEAYLALTPLADNTIAKDVANRANFDGKVSKAFEEASIGKVAGMNLLSTDFTKRLLANTASAITVNGANQRWTPVPSSGGINVDSRFQNLTLSATTNIAVGSRFTIAGVFNVNQASPDRTIQERLKTFTVTKIVSGTVIEITPPIICNDGGSPTLSDAVYKNVSATPANGAALTFLNTTTNSVCPIWTKNSIIVTPCEYTVLEDGGLLQATYQTKQGMKIQMFASNGTVELPTNKIRFDMFYGINNINPESTGAMLFNQA